MDEKYPLEAVINFVRMYQKVPFIKPDEDFINDHLRKVRSILSVFYTSHETLINDEEALNCLKLICMKTMLHPKCLLQTFEIICSALKEIANKHAKFECLKRIIELGRIFWQKNRSGNPIDDNHAFDNDFVGEPFYVIYAFVYSKIFPKRLPFFKFLHNKMKDIGDESLIYCTGAIFMIVQFSLALDKGLNHVDELIEEIIESDDPLQYSSCLCDILQACDTELCPNLKKAEGVSVALFRILLKRKNLNSARSVLESWLPLWSRDLLYGKCLQGIREIPGQNENEALIEGYTLLMNVLGVFLEKKEILGRTISNGEAKDEDYVIALVKCALRLLPFLTTRLENMKDAKDDPKHIMSLESEIAEVFLNLMKHVNGNVTKRELLLSAFSLDPTQETFNLIKKHSSEAYDCSQAPVIKNEFPATGCGYLAPDELFLEHPDWAESDIEDLVAMIGHTRYNPLVWTIPWSELYFKCYRYLSLANKRHDPVELKNLERDYMTAPTKCNMADFFEPGFLQFLEEDWDCDEIIEAKKQEKLRLEKAIRERDERAKISEMRAYRRTKPSPTATVDRPPTLNSDETTMTTVPSQNLEETITFSKLLRDSIEKVQERLSIPFSVFPPKPMQPPAPTNVKKPDLIGSSSLSFSLEQMRMKILQSIADTGRSSNGPSGTKRALPENRNTIRFNESLSSAKVPRVCRQYPPKRVPVTSTVTTTILSNQQKASTANDSVLINLRVDDNCVLSPSPPAIRSTPYRKIFPNATTNLPSHPPLRPANDAVLINLRVDDNHVVSPSPSTGNTTSSQKLSSGDSVIASSHTQPQLHGNSGASHKYIFQPQRFVVLDEKIPQYQQKTLSTVSNKVRIYRPIFRNEDSSS